MFSISGMPLRLLSVWNPDFETANQIIKHNITSTDTDQQSTLAFPFMSCFCQSNSQPGCFVP